MIQQKFFKLLSDVNICSIRRDKYFSFPLDPFLERPDCQLRFPRLVARTVTLLLQTNMKIGLSGLSQLLVGPRPTISLKCQYLIKKRFLSAYGSVLYPNIYIIKNKTLAHECAFSLLFADGEILMSGRTGLIFHQNVSELISISDGCGFFWYYCKTSLSLLKTANRTKFHIKFCNILCTDSCFSL